MDYLRIAAHAKVNLVLDVLGKRPDGYHQLETIMQSLELCDFVTVKRIEEGIELECDSPQVPLGPENLCYQAAEQLLKYSGRMGGVKIRIEKKIPVAAGLAGGSTDAAATLLGVNFLWGLGLTVGQLVEIGARLGADIPFCLIGGTVLARGIGEKLTLLPPAPSMWLVLVKPAFGVSTAEVYRKFDLVGPLPRLNIAGAVQGLEEQNMGHLLVCMGNALEAVTMVDYPEVRAIRDEMLDLGACRAVMCGSGPTVFAVASSKDQAHKMASYFRSRYGEVIVTRTLSPNSQD